MRGPASPRGHFMAAIETRTIVQAPAAPRIQREGAAPIRVDFSNDRLTTCIDVGSLAEKCNTSGFLADYLAGMRWEAIPGHAQGKCAADIRRFRKALREGGYRID